METKTMKTSEGEGKAEQLLLTTREGKGEPLGSPLYVRVGDVALAVKLIRELAIMVQTIKSTGDGQKARWLIDTYGKPIHNREHLVAMKRNLKAIRGPIKGTAHIFPHLVPRVDDKTGEVVDCTFDWPADIFDAYRLEKY